MMSPTSAPVQLPLLAPETLSPLPVAPGHYVAVLQNKTGELRALAAAADGVWERMTPLLEFVGPKTASRQLTASAAAAWVKRASLVLGQHPFYLDTLRLNATTAVQAPEGSRPVLRYLHDQARNRRMRFVPVVWVGEASEAVEQTVRDAAIADGHGVALRYRALEVLPPTGTSRRAFVEAQLDRVNARPEQADLLIDLQFIDEDRELAGEDLAELVDQTSTVGQWRSVALLGTTIPKTLGVIPEGTIGSLPRREWNLWVELDRIGLARTPAFGDYAVQHPHPPADGGGGNQMRANIRYTTDDATVVVRGRGPVTQEGNEQYRRLCEQLAALPEFAGRDYSWGDETIEDCADGVVPPGSQNQWRGVGTSHHMRHVTDALRRHPQPSSSD
jgi:hypothetical protein